MANQWLRLWHELPTDPKWRTIAKASGQSIGDVITVYIHLLVCASNAIERGRTQSFNSEDVATALDIELSQVDQIIAAMQGRVLDGDLVTAWAKRQVAREDGSAERSKAWRESKKAESERTPNATERNRTPDKEEIKIREEKKEKEAKASSAAFAPPEWVPAEQWADFVKMRKAMRGVPFTEAAAKGVVAELAKVMTASGCTAEQLLQTAVTNGWRTVYPPKSNAPIAVRASTGKHAGFQNLDYRDGVDDDGTFT